MMFQYIKVEWIHDFEDEPILLLSEINEERMECRKVEIYKDGTSHRACEAFSERETRLGEEAIPEIDEIASDAQFRPVNISKEEFECYWSK